MADDIINALQTANRSASVLQGIANPPQVNPLAAVTAGNQAAQAEFQTRKMQADQALGDAYRQAVDPETGRFNPLKFNQIVGGNPMTSFAAKGGVESSQVLQGAQLEQNAKMQGLLNESITAALASPDANLKQSVLEQAARLRAAGFPADRLDASLLHLSSDPAQLRQQLETVRVQSLPPDQRQSVIYGTPFRQTGPGGQTIGGVQNPRGGGVGGPPQAGLPLGQSPESTNQYVEIKKNPDGTVVMGTARQARNLAEGRDMNDDGPHAAGGRGGAGPNPIVNVPGRGNQIAPTFNPATEQPQVPGQPAIPYVSTTPPPMPPGARPDSPATHGRGPAAALPLVAPPAPAVAPTPGGGVTSGQTSSGAAAQSATGAASAAKFQDIVAQGTKARSQDALLATLLSEAQAFRTGPGADTAASIKRTILGIGAQFGTNFGIDEKKLASMESVIKIGNQLADAQGAGSDARLKVSEGANPSIHNTPAGLDLIIRQLRGNADYLRVRQQLAAAYPDKSDVEGFESKVGANLDPRVFQYERLAPGQRGEYYHGMTDKAAFRKAHDWAAQRNLFAPGG
jgi:hypothetical protein